MPPLPHSVLDKAFVPLPPFSLELREDLEARGSGLGVDQSILELGVGLRVTFISGAVAAVTVVFPESAALSWCLHGDQSISFIIPSTLAGKAGPRAVRAQWEP